MKRHLPEPWSIQEAEELYGINRWGADYFSLSPKGEVRVAAPFNGHKVHVSLLDIIKGMRERGLDMPAMLRIENLLDHRITVLNEAFRKAIADAGYRNRYHGVFPVKVNQQCHVIEEIAEFGSRYQHGLEAGSKPELIIALAHLKGEESCIVCNGYKDSEFIDLGLRTRQLGIRCFFVIETPTELPTIISKSVALGVKPLLGVRLKLSSRVDGHWQDDSGDRSIFGLSATQLIDVVDQLKAADMLDCLQLLHFHLGSQIPNIRNIRSGIREACRYYANLMEEGAQLGYIDLGGGLAVDYDGSQSNDTHSKNYTLDEYCCDVVEAVMETLDPLEIPHPVIITESGRATVAYSSMLLFDVLSVSSFDPAPLPARLPEDAPEAFHNLLQVLQALKPKNLQECFNDAEYYRDQVRELFRRGEVSLRLRSLAENLHMEILHRIAALIPEGDRMPQELAGLQESLADIYYGNFSVFQSLPDTWAIDQVFPLMPVHRLLEPPVREAVIADITCDCDGKIDHFVGGQSTILLHPLKEGEDYFLGAFLVGAYQETLGDLHNLFGDTHVVSVRINEDASFDFVKEIHGDSIADVLSYVEYEPKMLLNKFRHRAEQAVRDGKISVAARTEMLEAFSESLRGYTYHEK